MPVRRRVPNFHGTFVRELRTQPDAKSQTENAREALLGLHEFRSGISYGAALTEFNLTLLLHFFHVCTIQTRDMTDKDGQPVWKHPYILMAVGKFLIILLLTYAGANSGPHMNPNVTLATVIIGFTTLSRFVLYTIAQTLGAICGIALGRMAYGWDEIVTSKQLGGCGSAELPVGRALAGSTVLFFFVLVIIGGTAFNTKQAQIFGPVVGPLAISAAIGGSIILSSETYMLINWVECLAVGIVSGEFHGKEWVALVGPLLASIWHAVFFLIVPPTKAEGSYTPPIVENGVADDDNATAQPGFIPQEPAEVRVTEVPATAVTGVVLSNSEASSFRNVVV